MLYILVRIYARSGIYTGHSATSRFTHWCARGKTPRILAVEPAGCGAQKPYLLLIAALVASLAKQFTVLLLGHTLAALLNNGTHRISSLF